MANAIHRTTKQFLQSVNTPDYPTIDWIINPDMAAVVGFESRYWTIAGDVVGLMSVAQRAAVDAAQLEAQRDASASEVDQVEGVVRAFMLTMLDEFNAHATKINAILTAIDAGANLTAVKTNIVAIADYPTRTIAQLKTVLRAKLGT